MSFTGRKRLLHIALLMFVCAMMGGLFPLIKISEEVITPLTLGMLRALLASVVLLVFVGVVMKRNLMPLILQWRAYATLGILLGLFFISIPEAEERIPASLASLMTCIIPISTFLIATLVLRWEKFSFFRLGGGVIALAGVAMFIGVEKIQFGESQLAGVGIMFCGFVIYAVFLLYAHACRFDPFLATTGTMVYVTVLLCVVAFALEQPLALRPDKEEVLVTVIMGVLSTGAAYAVLNYLIVDAGAVFASTMGYFIPVFAIVASYFLVEDSISWLQVVGLVLTLVGAWLVNRKPVVAQNQSLKP